MTDETRRSTWPTDGGEMAALIRAHDWAVTPLGPIAHWPQSLRTALDMVLAMPGPATILWGPTHVQLYNDAYVAIARDRHPALLGRPVAEGWPEAYDEVIAPLLQSAHAGRPTRLADFLVTLHGPDGRLEERVFDTDWSPLRDESGAVAGALQTLADVTGRRRVEDARRENEERQSFLLGLSDALRPLADAAEIQATTTRCLAEHLSLDRSMYAEVEGERGAETGIIRGQYVRPSDGSKPPAVPFPERFTYGLFGARAMAGRYRGELLVVADIDADPGFEPSERAAWVAANVRAAVVAPLVKGGRLVAEFGVHGAEPRAWTDAEVSLVQEVAERTWAAVERARAEDALRKSEGKYRSLFETMGQGYDECEMIRDAEGRAVDYRITEMNPAFERLIGISADQARGRTAREIIPDLEDWWVETLDEIVRSGKPRRVENEVASLGRWYEVHVYPQGGDRFAALFEDITERKRAEASLRESEERQTFLLELSDALRPLADPAEIETAAARLLVRHVGANRAMYLELEGDEDTKAAVIRGQYASGVPLFPSRISYGDFAKGFPAEALQSHETLVVTDTVSDPRIGDDIRAAWLATNVAAVVAVSLVKQGRTIAAFGLHSAVPREWTPLEIRLVEDVADRTWAAVERARAEAALRESEERQAFLLTLGDAMRAQSSTNGLIEVAARLLGEHLAASRIMFAEFDEAKGVADIFHGWFADGAKPFPAVMRLEDYEGSIMDDLRAGRTVRIENARDPALARPDLAAIAELGVTALLSVPLIVGGKLLVNLSVHQHAARHWTDDDVALVQEVAERLWADLVRARAEAALRESEEKYRSVFDSIDEGFCIWDVLRDLEERIVDFRFLEVNPAFERQTGLSNVAGQLISEVAPGTEAEWIETYGEVARTGATKRFEMYHDDTGRWYDIYASRLGGPDSPRVSIVFKDISERKRAEQVLREGEERQTFLLMLSDRLRTEVDARAIAETSVSLLADHMRLDRAYVAQVDKGRDLAEIGPEYRRPDLAPVEGVLTLSDFPEAFARVEATTLVLADTAADPTLSDLDRRGFAELRMGALIVASARKGTRNPVWSLLVASEEPRRWTAGEVALVEETAERTWAAIERARAEAAVRESETRLRTLVTSLPGGAVFIVDNHLRYLLAQGEALTDAGFRPEDLVGRTIFEALPAELARDYEPYYRRALVGEPFELEHRAHGRTFVTRGAPLHFQNGNGRTALVVSYDITDRKLAEEALRESEERFRQFGEASSDVLWIRSAETLQWEYLSNAFQAIYGEDREAALAGNDLRRWAEMILPEDRKQALANIRRVRDGERVTFEYRIRRPSDGQVRWLRNTDFPLLDNAGRVERIGGIGHDATEEKEFSGRLQVLIAELQHRTRNLIAVVRSLSDKTLKESSSLDDFQASYNDRLRAVSRVQGLLSRLSEGQRITFDELLRTELSALGALDGHADRVTLDGPAGMRLRSGTVQTFALALHELATNAVKYGALSSPDGHLAVRWHVETNGTERRLHVEWRESGVAMSDPEAAPKGGGYGRELIERALPYQLKAETSYEMGPDGVRCTIAVPISEALSGETDGV